MKKVYSQPKVRKVSVEPNSIMVAYSYTGGYPDNTPEMGGTSASDDIPTMGTDAKRYWGI